MIDYNWKYPQNAYFKLEMDQSELFDSSIVNFWISRLFLVTFQSESPSQKATQNAKNLSSEPPEGPKSGPMHVNYLDVRRNKIKACNIR